ncbi:MAG: rhomboid family intramembrane serine protease, partial [Planctomycetes bacterium]|nr:rhomboid family intramembrane serine protease [Planctomycetota bacterium]
MAIASILASVVFWGVSCDGSTGVDNLMLWCGTTDVDTLFGEDELTSDELGEVTAALDEHRRNSGKQHAYQLITHAFLHADPFHLAGNLLFLMVFGTRVNALVGNVWTIALYPALAV